MPRIGYVALAACALALALSACATSYGRGGLLGGYSDRGMGPNLWRVRGTTNGYSGQNSSLTMALYRAAELAQGAGFPYFQVIGSNHRMLPLVAGNSVWSSGGGENATLEIRGALDAKPPTDCATMQGSCRTYSVEEVLRELGPRIHRRP